MMIVVMCIALHKSNISGDHGSHQGAFHHATATAHAAAHSHAHAHVGLNNNSRVSCKSTTHNHFREVL